MPKSKPNLSFIKEETFKDSLTQYTENNFVIYLFNLLGAEVTTRLIEKYFIGTSNYWEGATVFWQIDLQGKIRTGKIMLYDAITGKRIKEPFNHINWAHKVIKQPDFELRQCLFGEHLLCDKIKPIAIVESEKTAIISSAYLPQFIWLATGGIQNLNSQYCEVLKNRNVVLFPDLKGFDKWESEMGELLNKFPGTSFQISDYIESRASDEDKKQGLDIADYLIKFDPIYFQQIEEQQNISPTIDQSPEHDFIDNPIYFSGHESPIAAPVIETKDKKWDQEICELEEFFKKKVIPIGPVKLKNWETIFDVSLFTKSHLAIIKAQNGKRRFLPYLGRMQDLKKYLLKK